MSVSMNYYQSKLCYKSEQFRRPKPYLFDMAWPKIRTDTDPVVSICSVMVGNNHGTQVR